MFKLDLPFRDLKQNIFFCNLPFESGSVFMHVFADPDLESLNYAEPKTFVVLSNAFF